MLFTCRLLTYYLLGVLKQTVLQRFRWNLSFPKKQQLDYLFSNPKLTIVVANGIIVILNIFLKIWILNSWSTKALYKLGMLAGIVTTPGKKRVKLGPKVPEWKWQEHDNIKYHLLSRYCHFVIQYHKKK